MMHSDYHNVLIVGRSSCHYASSTMLSATANIPTIVYCRFQITKIYCKQEISLVALKADAGLSTGEKKHWQLEPSRLPPRMQGIHDKSATLQGIDSGCRVDSMQKSEH